MGIVRALALVAALAVTACSSDGEPSATRQVCDAYSDFLGELSDALPDMAAAQPMFEEEVLPLANDVEELRGPAEELNAGLLADGAAQMALVYPALDEFDRVCGVGDP